VHSRHDLDTHTWRFNHWQEGYGCCNLSNHALNLLLHFSFILLLRWWITDSTTPQKTTSTMPSAHNNDTNNTLQQQTRFTTRYLLELLINSQK